MYNWLKIFIETLESVFLSQRELALENLALRQQLAILKIHNSRPNLSRSDRIFWIIMFRYWHNWSSALHVVQPATIIRWHKEGFKRYWTRKSRRVGRPRVEAGVRHTFANSVLRIHFGERREFMENY